MIQTFFNTLFFLPSQTLYLHIPRRKQTLS